MFMLGKCSTVPGVSGEMY